MHLRMNRGILKEEDVRHILPQISLKRDMSFHIYDPAARYSLCLAAGR